MPLNASFAGLRVIAFESRRAEEMARLIRNYGGESFVAPSMKEAPLEANDSAFEFAERLFRGEFDMMILTTGVGTRLLSRLLATRYPEEHLAEALRRITVVPRGPKPMAALREMNVPSAVTVPEPHTWRELLSAIAGRPEKRIAVQEYGKPNQELITELQARGAEVSVVRIYGWALPDDTAPLREAARRLSEGEAEVAMFTTGTQVPHLFRVAEDAEALVRGLRRVVVASIGPTTSEMLEEYGIATDVVPSHPKMGYLVKETAEQAGAILENKRHAARR